jgi:signal transduction histidine kinase
VGCQWRIRHKLMLGLGLVVGIMALLLGGTLYGMMSFRDALKTFDSKLIELKAAQEFKEKVTALDRRPQANPGGSRAEPAFPSPDEIVADLVRLQADCRLAQEALTAYEAKLNDTVIHGRDLEPFYKRDLIEAMREGFKRLDQAAVAASQPESKPNASSREVMTAGLHAVHEEVRTLVTNANDLEAEIFKDQYGVIDGAKGDCTRSLVIVVVTCALGMLLLVGLHRLLYRWVFYPVRDLQQGVHRVAHGDFDHEIEVHSGDEMEELAAAFNDMTGRLRDMYADLAHQVNERSRQLVRSERLASVGFLAAGVAHEINNPLASIAFCSEALETRLLDLLHGPHAAAGGRAGEDQEVVTKYLKMIQQEAFRCKKITERLLEFSRGGERRREPTDLVELVQAVLDVVQHLQNGKGKQIVLHTPSRLVARVNAQEIKSVVLNLVVNALDSMDEGGTLTITLAQRDGEAELGFADTGCGMPPEVLENIFEPFFTRSRTGKGTGLGLSISHRVISQHGGEIEAVSPGVNQGSTFTVRLPLQPPAESVKEETLGHAAA